MAAQFTKAMPFQNTMHHKAQYLTPVYHYGALCHMNCMSVLLCQFFGQNEWAALMQSTPMCDTAHADALTHC